MAEIDAQIAAIRQFNRFYTRIIGVLRDVMMQSDFPLAEARVIHEVGKAQPVAARTLTETLDMDRGQLSRIVQRLTDAGVLSGLPDPEDGRATLLSLTEAGEVACADLNARSDGAAREILTQLSASDRRSLVAAMHDISRLLGDAARGPIVLRSPRIGELGWLIHRQAALYNQEQGWNGKFEALIARIYAEYEEAVDTPPKALWVAEQDGAIVGSIFILPAPDRPGVAQLRMLYVEPSARGQGLGHTLVDQAVRFSRQSGYQRISLWTQNCLVAARTVYQRAGFKLVAEERHHSFGTDLNGQYWELELDNEMT